MKQANKYIVLEETTYIALENKEEAGLARKEAETKDNKGGL